jgi:hypothetical protein
MTDSDFNLWVKIDQFTENPLSIEGVDERLAWIRSYTSWRKLKLENFQLVHLRNIIEEHDSERSRLGFNIHLKAANLYNAIQSAYAITDTQLNILSVVTGRGFGIITVFHSEKERTFDNYEEDVAKLDKNAIVGPSIKYSPNTAAVQTINLGDPFDDYYNTFHDESGLSLNEHEKSAVFHDILNDRPRFIIILKIEDVIKNWQIAFETYWKGSEGRRSRLNRCMSFWKASRMSRDIYSRYTLDWITLEQLTDSEEPMGKVKTNKISRFIEQYFNLSFSLASPISKLYETRKDIAHGRRTDRQFLVDCKQDLILLEWFLRSVMSAVLGFGDLNTGVLIMNGYRKKLDWIPTPTTSPT